MGAVSEGIAGGLIIVIWQPQHKGFSASHWHPGTSVADDARRLDCAKWLLGAQIRIPGSDRVRSPWCMGVLRQFSRCPYTSASSSSCLKTDLRPVGAKQLWSVYSGDNWPGFDPYQSSPPRKVMILL